MISTLKGLLKTLWRFLIAFNHAGTVVTCQSYDIIQYLKAINYEAQKNSEGLLCYSLNRKEVQ